MLPTVFDGGGGKRTAAASPVATTANSLSSKLSMVRVLHGYWHVDRRATFGAAVNEGTKADMDMPTAAMLWG